MLRIFIALAGSLLFILFLCVPFGRGVYALASSLVAGSKLSTRKHLPQMPILAYFSVVSDGSFQVQRWFEGKIARSLLEVWELESRSRLGSLIYSPIAMVHQQAHKATIGESCYNLAKKY